MTISFDAIPALRTPGTYIEFNNELAGATSTEFKAVIYGQRLTTGTVAEVIPTRVTDPAQASKYFGLGSMLHKMCSKFLAANPTTPMYVIALDDNAAGTAAAGTITQSPQHPQPQAPYMCTWVVNQYPSVLHRTMQWATLQPISPQQLMQQRICQ